MVTTNKFKSETSPGNDTILRFPQNIMINKTAQVCTEWPTNLFHIDRQVQYHRK